jgi:hypothetical protein
MSVPTSVVCGMADIARDLSADVHVALRHSGTAQMGRCAWRARVVQLPGCRACTGEEAYTGSVEAGPEVPSVLLLTTLAQHLNSPRL